MGGFFVARPTMDRFKSDSVIESAAENPDENYEIFIRFIDRVEPDRNPADANFIFEFVYAFIIAAFTAEQSSSSITLRVRFFFSLPFIVHGRVIIFR